MMFSRLMSHGGLDNSKKDLNHIVVCICPKIDFLPVGRADATYAKLWWDFFRISQNLTK